MEYFFNELEAPKGHCASTHFVPPTQAMQNQGMVKREIIKTEIQYRCSDSFNNFVLILMAWSNSMLTGTTFIMDWRTLKVFCILY